MATAKKSSTKKAASKKGSSKKSGSKKTAGKKKPASGGSLFAKTTAAAEPPINRDPAHLLPEFRAKLDAVLAQLAAEGTPFKFHEGFRTAERQQWLYGSGRPDVKPYGRPGDVVTQRDGVKRLSNHQGNGTPGTGRAADCYPTENGKVIWPPPKANDPRWRRYADLARAEGLDAGFDWTSFKDLPHVELLV